IIGGLMPTTTRRMLSLAAAMLVSAVTSSARAQGAATVCNDGTRSTAVARGACSRHGGVDETATRAARERIRADAKAERVERKVSRGDVKAETKLAKIEEKAERKADKADEKAERKGRSMA